MTWRPRNGYPGNHIQDYVKSTPLPVLSDGVRDLLDTPFTQQKVEGAIALLNAGKAPGPDGFDSVLYSTFKEQVAPILTTVFNAVSPECPFPRQ